jgi:DNA-binding NarL/FixJ family response regulator
MKPFTADDVRFAQAAAPHIAHALSIAARVASPPEPSSEFAPRDDLGKGVIVLGCGGRVIAADATAQAIFQEMALFDGYSMDSFAHQRLATALAYIDQTLRSIFEDRADPWTIVHSPSVRLYSHRIGLVLKLRGVVVDGETDQRQVVVLVEAGERAEHRRRRIMDRYGLSPRLMELGLMASGLSSPEASGRMGLSKFTLQDYLHRLMERLQLPDRASLRRFAEQLRFTEQGH